MKRLQAFKFALKLSSGQLRKIAGFAGSCRFVYNKALALQKERYERGEKRYSYAGLCKQLTEWRHTKVFSWLGELPSQALQQSLKDLERAYQNFFQKRADFPRFKKRGMRDAFRLPQGVKLDQPNSRIFLPKLGWVRYRNSREVLGKLCNVTISKSCDQYFKSGARSVSLWRDDAFRSLDESGTHRSDSGEGRMSAVGISAIKWRRGCQHSNPFVFRILLW